MIKNLDIGRPLVRSDIVGPDTFPMQPGDEGCFCYLCADEGQGRVDDLEPLKVSSGVFTRLVMCQMEAPVWLCLEHLPFGKTEFEVFEEGLRAQLRSLRHARDAVDAAATSAAG